MTLGGNPGGPYGTGALLLHNDGETLTLSGSITLAGTTQIRGYSAGGTTTFSQPIGGTGPLTFDAGGAVATHNQYYVLGGGPSTYTGTTVIAGNGAANAIVQLGGGSLPSGTVLYFQDGNANGVTTDAVLDLAGNNQTVAGLTNGGIVGRGDFVMNSSSVSGSTLTVNAASGNSYTFNGVIGVNTTNAATGQAAGSGNIALVKTGAGTQILATNGNTYTGGTFVNQGTLQLNNGGQTGSTPAGGNINVNNGGTLFLNTTDSLGYSTGAANLFVNSGGTVTTVGGARTTVWNNVTMTGGYVAATGSGPADGGSGFATNYSLRGNLSATSDASGNPATISASVGMQYDPTTNPTGSVTFNVAKGPGAVQPECHRRHR